MNEEKTTSQKSVAGSEDKSPERAAAKQAKPAVKKAKSVKAAAKKAKPAKAAVQMFAVWIQFEPQDKEQMETVIERS